MEALSILFIGHWMGDFVFQSTKMAVNKSRSLKWLGIHILTYTIVFSIFSAVAMPLAMGLKFGVANGLIHGVVDFFTSKVISRYQGRPRVYFPLIGFDQLIHVLTILWTFEGRLIFS